MPESSTELFAFILMAIALIVIPSLLAYALFSLARSDRNSNPAALRQTRRSSPRRSRTPVARTGGSSSAHHRRFSTE